MAEVAEKTNRIIAVYGEAQRRAILQATIRAVHLWKELQGSDMSGAWMGGVGRAMVQAVAAGQLLAASTGQSYVDAMVSASHELSDYSPGASTVNVRSLSGVAADGRALDSLLYLPVIRAKTLIRSGVSQRQAYLGGQVDLQRMVTSEIADAGWSATRLAMTSNHAVNGYVRCIRPGACARCAVLAGRVYHWSADFARHPHCGCYGVPATKNYHAHITDADSFFSGLSRAEQDRRFTAAGAQAIRDGADISSVVNARRKGAMYTTTAYGRQVRATREGTTRRGDYYYTARRQAESETGTRYARSGAQVEAGMPSFRLRTPRLMPEEIYAMARERTEVIGLLRRYGYLS